MELLEETKQQMPPIPVPHAPPVPEEPSSANTDLDELAMAVDRHTGCMRREILDYCMSMKQRLVAQNSGNLDMERRRGVRQLEAKQQELEDTKDALEEEQIKLKSAVSMLLRTASALGRANEKKHGQRAMVLAFIEWRAYALAKKRGRALEKRAVEHYESKYMKLRVLRRWRQLTFDHRRTRLRGEVAAQLDQDRASLRRDMQAELDRLAGAVAERDETIRHRDAALDALENSYKRSFMRGVCALNLEAMQLMKRGAPASGVNPFPITVPVPPEMDATQPGAAPGGGPDDAAAAASEVETGCADPSSLEPSLGGGPPAVAGADGSVAETTAQMLESLEARMARLKGGVRTSAQLAAMAAAAEETETPRPAEAVPAPRPGMALCAASFYNTRS